MCKGHMENMYTCSEGIYLEAYIFIDVADRATEKGSYSTRESVENYTFNSHQLAIYSSRPLKKPKDTI